MGCVIALRKKARRVLKSFRSYLSSIYELSETHPRATYRAIFSLEFVVVFGLCLAVGVGLITGAVKGVEKIIRSLFDMLCRGL